MDVIKISTDKCPKPSGWYSWAFRAGDLIFAARVTANDSVAQELIGSGDVVKQTEQILKNMDNLLWETDPDLDHVMKTLVFVSSIDGFEIFNGAYKKYLPHNSPVRSTMQTGKFNHSMVIEIEAVTVATD